MTPQERDMIADLFQRLRSVDTGPVDAEARALIERLANEQPVALYLLVQTVLVQEHALKGAQAHIAELEARLSDARPGTTELRRSFLSGLLGDAEERPSAPQPRPVGPWGRPSQPPPAMQSPQVMQPPMQATPWSSAGMSQAPGFLRSAMMTAAGVAGGALLFQGIEHMLGYGGSPFAQAGYGGGGFAPRPVEETVINNYYDRPEHGTAAADAAAERDDDDGVAAQDASYTDDDDSSLAPADDDTSV